MSRVAMWITLVGLLVPGVAGAQNLLFTRQYQEFIGLEFLRPEFHGESLSAGTFVIFGSVRRMVYRQVAVKVEASFTRYEADAFSGVEYSLGNVYLGLEEERERAPYWWSVGIQLPTISDKSSPALFTALVTDVNRWEAFLPETISLIGAVGYRAITREGFGAAARVAPVLWVPSQGGGKAELSGLYAGHLVYEGTGLELRGGVSGRIWLTAGSGDLGDKTFHQLDLAINAITPSVCPGFHIRIPLDESLTDEVKVIYGLQLAFKID